MVEMYTTNLCKLPHIICEHHKIGGMFIKQLYFYLIWHKSWNRIMFITHLIHSITKTLFQMSNLYNRYNIRRGLFDNVLNLHSRELYMYTDHRSKRFVWYRGIGKLMNIKISLGAFTVVMERMCFCMTCGFNQWYYHQVSLSVKVNIYCYERRETQHNVTECQYFDVITNSLTTKDYTMKRLLYQQ